VNCKNKDRSLNEKKKNVLNEKGSNNEATLSRGASISSADDRRIKEGYCARKKEPKTKQLGGQMSLAGPSREKKRNAAVLPKRRKPERGGKKNAVVQGEKNSGGQMYRSFPKPGRRASKNQYRDKKKNSKRSENLA